MTSDARHGRAGTAGTAGTGGTGESTKTAKAALRDLVADVVAEKVADKAAEHAAKHERVAQRAGRKAAALERAAGKVSSKAARHQRAAEKAAIKADVLESISSGLSALDLWTRGEPAARRPRFTHDEIAQAAMRIADTEGFDALSMRRLAAELDAGTMTLYHYVRTKDEVLTLLVDAVMGEIILGPDEPMPADWRAAMTTIANRSRAAVQRHAWILDMTDDPALGPNSVRHFDQSLEAVASLPITLTEKLDIVSLVDEYVFGYCLTEREGRHPDAEDGGMVEYVNSLIATGDYPQLAALMDEYGLDEAWEQIEAHRKDPEQFERNLRRLLDGIQADLPPRG